MTLAKQRDSFLASRPVTAQGLLVEVHSDAAMLMAELEACDDEEATQAFLSALFRNQAKQAQVVDACVQLHHHIEAEIAAAKAYLAHMQGVIKGRIAQLEYMDERMSAFILEQADQGILPQRMLGQQGAIAIRTNPPSCDVYIPADELPPEFQRVKVEPDKKALLAALKAGEEVPGAELVQTQRVEFKFTQTQPEIAAAPAQAKRSRAKPG